MYEILHFSNYIDIFNLAALAIENVAYIIICEKLVSAEDKSEGCLALEEATITSPSMLPQPPPLFGHKS